MHLANRKLLPYLALAISISPNIVNAVDLFEVAIIGVEQSINQDPPILFNEVSGSQAHTINCTMRIGANMGTSGIPTTSDLDNIGYYAQVQCAKPSVMGVGGTVTVGRTGVTKRIVSLQLCEKLAGSPPAPLCQYVHTAVVPPASTSDSIMASGEFESVFLDLTSKYYVVARIELSNPNTEFTGASTVGTNSSISGDSALTCGVLDASSTPNKFSCLVVSPSFRYVP